MGKKSKRSRGGGGGAARSAPALREGGGDEVETPDNLKFEDPFADEYYNDEDDPDAVDDGNDLVKYETLNPYHATKEPLEMDPAAYKMHLALRGEWPSLSFDFVQDAWGNGRTRFPHQLLAVVGTQAEESKKNALQIWKLSDLGKLDKDGNGDDDDEDYDKEEDDKDSDDEEDMDYDPVLEHASTQHDGGINRVRCRNGVVATWSDIGVVNLYTMDVERLCETNQMQAPSHFYAYKGHSTEGFAIDFSSAKGGGNKLASGDNSGAIHVFDENYKSASNLYTAKESIEDIQWSPTEATVFCAGEAGGLVQIYDVRAPNRSMLQKSIASDTDVNAVAWSNLVTNLLATGCDDGTWSVWDLRKFDKDPLARFTSHTTPITSMEWHPTDESMLVVSDEVGSFIYDLSVEEEEGAQAKKDDANADDKNDLPPQLLFVHSGSPQTKEVHWHPQISSLLMSTAYDGFHTFIPSNL
jgi:ribosome assembly protein RRB1